MREDDPQSLFPRKKASVSRGTGGLPPFFFFFPDHGLNLESALSFFPPSFFSLNSTAILGETGWKTLPLFPRLFFGLTAIPSYEFFFSPLFIAANRSQTRIKDEGRLRSPPFSFPCV